MVGKVLDLDPQSRHWFYAEKQARTRARHRVRAGQPSPYQLAQPFPWLALLGFILLIPLGVMLLSILLGWDFWDKTKERITATRRDNYGNY